MRFVTDWRRASRAVAILMSMLALAACTLVAPAETDAPISLAEPYGPPLSKVNVHNPTDRPIFVKLLWPQDFAQLFRVEAGSTSFLTGAIGVVVGPPQLEVLTLECEVLEALDGQPGDDVLVNVEEDGAELYAITQADRQWTQAASAEDCGVTIAP
jgi:hypothetical protein